MVAAVPYADFLAHARRHARRQDDAEDIVQEALIAALVAGRADFSSPTNRRWLFGAIRNRARFDARGAARRRRREGLYQADSPALTPPRTREEVGALLLGLAPSLRVVAALALSGHTRREIAYLLDLSDVALRQRIMGVRKALRKLGVAMPEGLPGLSLDLAYGAIRAALGPALARHGGAFASHDPDGHIFVLTRSRK